jgi:hypothetical protein
MPRIQPNMATIAPRSRSELWITIQTPASTIITPEIKNRSIPSVIPSGANE